LRHVTSLTGGSTCLVRNFRFGAPASHRPVGTVSILIVTLFELLLRSIAQFLQVGKRLSQTQHDAVDVIRVGCNLRHATVDVETRVATGATMCGHKASILCAFAASSPMGTFVVRINALFGSNGGGKAMVLGVVRFDGNAVSSGNRGATVVSQQQGSGDQRECSDGSHDDVHYTLRYVQL